ncbi:MAG TPA: RDD family protein [Phycisphaerales bacterium]|nr:RDD family protein [Phycisphaerales bacterium]HMP37675.1 RDD family protein [Phycisphaerales bacterium]
MPGGPRVASELPDSPEALVASGDRLWFALPAARGGTAVWTLRAVRNQAMETFFNDPPNRFDLVPSLPAGSAIEAIAALRGGLIAAVRDRAVEGLPSAAAPGRLRVLRQEGAGWSELAPLPRDAQRLGEIRLAGLSGGAEDEVLLAISDPAEGSVDLWRGRAGLPGAGGWRRIAEGLDGSAVAILDVEGRPVVLTDDGGGRWRAHWVRPDAVLRGAPIDARAGVSALIGDGELAYGVELDGDRRPTLHPLDLRSGRWSDPIEAARQRSPRERFAHVALLGLLAGTATILTLLFRADRISAALPLPAGLVAGEFGARSGALLIDYALGAGVAILITGASLMEVLLQPIWTAPIERAFAPMLAFFLTAMIAGIAEAATGRSIGKRLAGVRVLDERGGRAGAAACLGRALVKFVVLCLPLLAIIHLINPVRRGLPELLTGTWVLARAPDATPSA